MRTRSNNAKTSLLKPVKRSASNRFFWQPLSRSQSTANIGKIISVTQESLAFNHNEHCFVRGSHEMSDINSKEAYLSIVQVELFNQVKTKPLVKVY